MKYSCWNVILECYIWILSHFIYLLQSEYIQLSLRKCGLYHVILFFIFYIISIAKLVKKCKQILLQARFLHLLKLKSGIRQSFLSSGSTGTIVDVHSCFSCFHCIIASWYVGGLKNKKHVWSMIALVVLYIGLHG